MSQLFSKDHTILEKGTMEFRPFGVDDQGKKIRDVTGIKVEAYVTFLQETVDQTQGKESGTHATEKLCELLNQRIPDSSYHVTPSFLKNIWNSYSYEFVCFLTEFCILLSEDPQFQYHVGRAKLISPIIQTLGRPFPVSQIYKMFPHFGQKFAKDSIHFGVGTVTDDSAVLRMKYTDHVYEQFGSYRKRCAEQICQASKAALAAVPEHIHHLGYATIQELQCIANGDDWCEWKFTWSPASQIPFGWALGGILAGVGAFTYLQLFHDSVNVVESLVIALFPPIIAWLGGSKWQGKDRKRLEALIREQLETVEDRHEELREAYLEQEQATVELRHKVAQLTTLHRAGLLFSSTLDRENLIRNVLEAIIRELHYDRAMIMFYDSNRQVACEARVLGFPEGYTAFARSIEVPITDPTSLEGQVLLEGRPILVTNGDQHKIWERLHILNKEFGQISKGTSLIAVSLKVQDKVTGSLVVDRIRPPSLTQDDLDVMVTVATQVAIALDNTEAYHQIEELNVSLEKRVQERTAELEAAYKELKDLDRLKSQFLAHVSHELRSPLTSIKGLAENMLEKVTGSISEKQEQYLQRIQANSARLARMITDLLDRARLEAGKMEVVLGEVPILRVAEEVIEQLKPLAHSNGQALTLQSHESNMTVYADSDKVSQILTNLVENALKYTPEGGSIMVRIHMDISNCAKISVIDNGVGIPSETLPNIFKPFFQVSRHQGTHTKGLGLGLSIVKQLVELMRGTITVESEHGKGTAFHITFPLGQVRATQVLSHPQLAKRILVVDDDPDIRELVVDRLKGDGYNVEPAINGQDALGALQTNSYDGVILDIGLPDFNGVQILQTIRKKYPNLPVLMVTASESKGRAMAALEQGANAYLLKPFDLAQFKHVTTQWFGSQDKIKT